MNILKNNQIEIVPRIEFYDGIFTIVSEITDESFILDFVVERLQNENYRLTFLNFPNRPNESFFYTLFENENIVSQGKIILIDESQTNDNYF